MSNYRRMRIKGVSYFFTVALSDRRSDLLVREIDALRAAYVSVQRSRPFECGAFVVLPDHLHAVWTLPPDDHDFSTRWQVLKAQFTMRVRHRGRATPSKTRKRETGIWQRRFWEHMIRDEADYAAHVRYCWANPVKHGWAEAPVAWPHSSLHRDILRGVVPVEWSCGGVEADAVIDPFDRDGPATVRGLAGSGAQNARPPQSHLPTRPDDPV